MLALLILLAGCEKDDGEADARFNAADRVDITVGPSASGEPVTIELFSTTGANLIGTATVDPSAGPAGTDHEVTVLVDEAYQGDVDRVSLAIDAGPRGTSEHELRQDSADHGLWVRTLESQGEPDEERTDTFEFQLWELVPAGEGDSEGEGG